jgi:signal transduction histidine kinase
LLAGIPHREREAAVQTMSSGPWHFRLVYGKPVQGKMSAEEAALASRVRGMLPDKRQKEPVTVRLHDLQQHPEIHPPPLRHRPADEVVEITLPVVRGTQLITRFFLERPDPWPGPFLPASIVAILTASAAAAFAARRVARPLSKLAAAASEVARGGDAPRVPEEGPDDVRRAAQAFNAMTDQVGRTLESQRQLLSAVGHDLRTPITAMRISAEFIADEEVKERIEKNLEELQALTEAVLSAARNAGWEKRRRIDLAALVESVCADLEEMDKPVAWEAHAAVPVSCRPNEIRRAVRNLIENAIAYGGSAHVALAEEDHCIAIRIDDNGPGIADDDKARVFEPFVRLESSRSAETGGAGLGLTLVKAIAEGHGGSIRLENRPEGGLRATLRLPREAATA